MKKLVAIALTCWLLPAAVMARDSWQSDEAIRVVSALLQSLNQIVEMSADDQMQPDAVQSKNAHAALVDIRFMVEELERLDLALSAGKSKIQTLARYQKISNLRYSVQDYSRDTEIPEDVRNEAQVATDLLRKLDLIYF
ncbi:hypothetical protein ACFL1S_02760 [Pseudomonadota bacterium]